MLAGWVNEEQHVMVDQLTLCKLEYWNQTGSKTRQVDRE